MKRAASRIGLAVVVFGLVAGMAGRATADLVTYDFTGTVTGTTGSGAPGFTVGSTFTGTITIDQSTPAVYTSATESGYYSAVTNFTVTAGGSTINGSDVLGMYNQQSVNLTKINDNIPYIGGSYDGIDSYLASYDSVDSSKAFGTSLEFVLRDIESNPTALSSTNLPGTDVNLSAFNFTAVQFANWETIPSTGALRYDNGFTGSLTSLTAESTSPLSTPEPSSLISGGIAGLMGLGCAWRRYRRAQKQVAAAV